MGLDRKRALVERLDSDVVVIPECASSTRLSEELGVSSAWTGRYDRKGLGVFAFGGWTVDPIRGHGTAWSLPSLVYSPDGDEQFILVAVWTQGPERAGGLSYASQVREVIDHWEREIGDGRVVLAGDFNCSAQTADPTAHMENVRKLATMGMHSAYHWVHGLPPGDEDAMTLRWVGRGGSASWFHCDFVFVPTGFTDRLISAQVGDPAEWVGPGLSDHAPVRVELTKESPLATADVMGGAARMLVRRLLGRYRERFVGFPEVTIPGNDQIVLPQGEFHGTAIALTVVYRVIATADGLALEYLELSKAACFLSRLGVTAFDDVPLSSEYESGFRSAVIDRGMVPRDGSQWTFPDGSPARLGDHPVIPHLRR